MSFKKLTEEWKARLLSVLAPRFLGRDQDHLLRFADEIVDINEDHTIELIQPLQNFDSDLQSPAGAGMVGILDAENYYGGVSTVEEALQSVGIQLETIAGVDLSDLAPKDSPVLTGNPTAPTPAAGDNDTSIATTAFVKVQGYLVPANIAGLAPLANPTFTGNPQGPTPATADNSTSLATTAFVKAQGYLSSAAATAVYAPIDSPVFTGDPQAPTRAPGDNDTSIATTAFVKSLGYITDAGVAHLAGTETFTGTKSFSAQTLHSAGLRIADAVAVSPDIVSGHIQLHSSGGGYGFNITASALNIAAGTGGGVYVYPNNTSTNPALSVSPTGVLSYGSIEIGYRDLPRVTGGLERGKCFAAGAGFTVSTGSAGGSTYHVYNNTAGNITITQGAGLTLRLSGTATTGSRTLAPRGFATLWFNSTTECIASGDVS